MQLHPAEDNTSTTNEIFAFVKHMTEADRPSPNMLATTFASAEDSLCVIKMPFYNGRPLPDDSPLAGSTFGRWYDPTTISGDACAFDQAMSGVTLDSI